MLRSHTLNIGGNEIHYVDSGSENKASDIVFVFIHGLESSHLSWKKVCDLLAGQVRVVAIDLLGFGFSDKPVKGDYSVDGMAKLLGQILDSLNLSNIVLLGHSVGGAICDLYVRTNPKRVEGLVFLAPLGLDLIGKNAVEPKVAKNILLFSYARKERIDFGVAQQQAKFYATPDLQKLRDRIADQLLNQTPQCVPAMKTDTPTLIVWGQEDLVLPIKHKEAFLNDHPGSIGISLEDTGHDIQGENPMGFVQALKSTNFLDEDIGNVSR